MPTFFLWVGLLSSDTLSILHRIPCTPFRFTRPWALQAIATGAMYVAAFGSFLVTVGFKVSQKLLCKHSLGRSWSVSVYFHAFSFFLLFTERKKAELLSSLVSLCTVKAYAVVDSSFHRCHREECSPLLSFRVKYQSATCFFCLSRARLYCLLPLCCTLHRLIIFPPCTICPSKVVLFFTCVLYLTINDTFLERTFGDLLPVPQKDRQVCEISGNS